MAPRPELIHVVGGMRWGGPQRYALDICRHFSAEGWKVTAFTLDARAVDLPFEEARIRLRHAPLSGMLDIPSAFLLARMIRRIPVGMGVVHTGRFRDAFIALLARKIARRKDIRVIHTAHSMKKGRDTALARRTYRNLDAIIFPSRQAALRFRSTWSDLNLPLPFPEGRVKIMHPSILIKDPVMAPEPERGPVVAMFHGPLAPGKGIETLIDALPLLGDVKLRLRLVGTGEPDYVDSLRRRAQARGVMEMIDWKKFTRDPLPFITESHFGVLPSVKEEALGMANMEYMAYGRPQICCGRGTQREYLTDSEEALIVPPGDATALADAMRQLAASPDLRRSLGANALATFTSRLAWPHFIARLQPLYLPS